MCHRHCSSRVDLMEDEDRMLRLPEVCQMCGISRSTVYRLRAKGLFPDQALIGETRAVGWHLQDIRQWLKNRPTARSRRVVSR